MGRKGFTLIEILLSLALIGIITTISIPVLQSFLSRNDLDVTSQTFVQSLRRAQCLAEGCQSDSKWGVKIQTGNITIFRGDSYANRETDDDESFDVSAGVTTSGLSEIVFSKLSGVPLSSGVTNINSSQGETKIITTNEKGIASY